MSFFIYIVFYFNVIVLRKLVGGKFGQLKFFWKKNVINGNTVEEVNWFLSTSALLNNIYNVL